MVVDGYYPEILDNDFILPLSSDHSFFVKVSFKGGPTTQIKLEPRVEKAEMSAKTLAEIYGGGKNNDSITNLITSNNETLRAKGIRNFQAVVEHLVSAESENKNVSKFVTDLKYKAAVDLLKVSISK